MTSSTPFDDFRSNLRQPIRYRHRSSKIIDEVAHFVVVLFNRSLAAGHFPAGFKEAFFTPIAKKPGLDFTDVCSYRPITNLSVLPKLLERPVARQMRDYLTPAELLPNLQSGFRPVHSTETAVLRVLSDILQAVDRGNSAALVLLDLSAAFDTVDHEILLQRLRVTFGIQTLFTGGFSRFCFVEHSMYGAGFSNHQ